MTKVLILLALGTLGLAQAAGISPAQIIREVEKVAKLSKKDNAYCKSLATENTEKITSYVSSLPVKKLQNELLFFSRLHADHEAGGKAKKNIWLSRPNEWIDEEGGTFSLRFSQFGSKQFEPSVQLYVKAAGTKSNVCIMIK